jgi:hypothetical protein
MKVILNLFIIQILFIQSVVFANDGRIHVYKKQVEINQILELYKTNPKAFFEKTKSSVLKRFKTAEDKKFYESVIDQYLTVKPQVSLSYSKNTLVLKTKNQKINIQITDTQNLKLMIKKRSIDLTRKISLEKYTNELAKLMNDKSIVQNFLNALVSSAHAGFMIPIMIGLMAISAVSYFTAEYRISIAMDLLDDMLNACEKISKGTKYKESEFYELYTEFIEEFGKENTKELSIVSCSSYVSREYQKEDISYTREELQEICEKGQKANDCHRNNLLSESKSDVDRNITIKEPRISPAKLINKKESVLEN